MVCYLLFIYTPHNDKTKGVLITGYSDMKGQRRTN